MKSKINQRTKVKRRESILMMGGDMHPVIVCHWMAQLIARGRERKV